MFEHFTGGPLVANTGSIAITSVARGLLLEEHPDWVVICTDARNAYNSVSRRKLHKVSAPVCLNVLPGLGADSANIADPRHETYARTFLGRCLGRSMGEQALQHSFNKLFSR